MEFLHSPEGDDEHVVLLLIVYKDEKPKLICYEWDSGKGLVTVQAKVNGRLHLADRDVPLLLIPLTKSTAFMLVSVQQITVYRGILTGQAKAYILPIYAHEPPEEPGRTTKPPVWTQWARPSRHDLHVQKQDNIYLCREDGVVHFLEIMDNLEQMLECTHMVGMLGINVDTSFASIDLGSRGCDLLVAGGDFCDGGGWLFEPRRSAQKQFNLPNWTPLIDYAAVSVAKNSECKSSRELQISNTEQSPPRFFASTGQGSRHGAVTEIRYGIEAPKEIALELSQAGVIQLWALEFVLDSSYRAVMMIFLSYPTSTLVLMFDMEGNTHEDVIDIEFNARTIAVGTSKNGLIVQITDKSITAVQPYHKMKRIFNLHILAACIKTLEEQDIETVVLTAVREEEKVFLCFGCLGFDGQQIYYHLIGERIHLSSEPSAMSLEIIEGKLTTFVGTLTSKLQIYQADPECGLSLALEYSFDGQVAICDSLSVLATNMLDSTDKCRILCGLRNGFIEILEVKSESSGK